MADTNKKSYLHYNPEWMNMYPGQYYAICAKKSSQDPLEDWRKCMEILVEDIEFHELIKQFGVFILVNPDLSFEWSHNFPMDGIRQSLLSKAVWDKYHPLLEDYGLYLARAEGLK